MIQHILRITHIEIHKQASIYINISSVHKKNKTNKKSCSLVMDLAVAWYQEEQEGEAKRIWSNIWETAEMVSFDFLDNAN